MISARGASLVLAVVLAIGLGPAARGQEPDPRTADDDSGPGGAVHEPDPRNVPRQPDRTTLIFEADAARFAGDFGTDRDITYDILTTRFRWLSRRLEWRVTVPFLRVDKGVLLVGGIPVPGPAGAGGSEAGLGDVLARGQVWAVRGTARRPWIGLLAEVKLPTADEDKGLGTGEADLRAGARVIQNVGRTSLLFDASYTIMGDPDFFDFENVVRIGAGVARPVGKRHQVYAYLENRTHPIPDQDDRLMLLLGDSARLGRERRIRFSASVLAGLSETAADWGVVLSLGRQF